MNKFTWYLYSPLFLLKWHKIYDRKIRSCHKFAAYSWRSCQTSLANLFTGDETSVHYIEPKSKSSYKTLASKKVKRSRIAEGFQTVRKIWYVIFFYNKDPVMQIWQKGKTVKGTFFIKTWKFFFYKSRRPKTGIKFLWLLQKMCLHRKHARIWRRSRLLPYHTSNFLQILPYVTSCCCSALNSIYFEKIKITKCLWIFNLHLSLYERRLCWGV